MDSKEWSNFLNLIKTELDIANGIVKIADKANKGKNDEIIDEIVGTADKFLDNLKNFRK